MLEELVIKNFAIISDLRLSFEKGMTVLTGETGAGKSIIIDAVGLLVGGRGSADFIRHAEEKSVLEGQFFVNERVLPDVKEALEQLGIEMDDQTVIISRTIFRSGKNICRVNNQLVNTTALKQIGQFLVDIHGQHEHQSLMNSERHIGYLDQFAIQEIHPILMEYQEVFHQQQTLSRQIRQLETNEKEFVQRMDMLNFQREEIETAEISVGEEQKLLEERQMLVNHQKITDALNMSYQFIQNDEMNSLSNIGQAMSELETISDLTEDFKTLYDEVASSYYQLEEAARTIQSELSGMEMDEKRLNHVEERLNTIRQMKRKYGDSEESILEHYDNVVKELEESMFSGAKQERLEQELAEATANVQVLSHQLTTIRTAKATILEEAIVSQLKDLYLDKTIFNVVVEPVKPYELGSDLVTFYISTNPGEEPKPLTKVASGGELSRVMLGMKSIFSESQGITSIIFDEVDTGVSGRVAQAIANKIHQIATDSQVLCITHLPQVAASADHHYFIEKHIVDERTQTTVYPLSKEQRVDEVARMLAGEVITDLSKQHAKELLNLSTK
ncbi:DNA repair protein RecN [Vagococcus xieshaowenii]|uniref:DNA repair protein RecN n=1 Tax=Vagococcus xieshaowenii TaxID=2562451 RepID=A0A4Z0DBT2_9ENTE|nr:DNA repair protein RecN [Vagococcus xieshaowenii]QCA28289.1 DNA repair protein RecN [Vagococcus xieshaowenii]TFZ42323.1 DNA repair protein RecN [Vagococcus xieshaowenii]